MSTNQNEKLTLEIANKLKEIRLKKSLTQTDVAKKAGINSNYYSKVERGEAKPSVVTIEKITKALGITSSEILPF
ncbi:MAG: helix-turn-helix transcriptional regulator [Patescibacteria group bacterium]|nr:helix-turn-helix transcriptional regulator [Patescibacteria group bacterium]